MKAARREVILVPHVPGFDTWPLVEAVKKPHDFYWLSVGGLLREYAKDCYSVMQTGGLVPNEKVLQILKDNFPRDYVGPILVTGAPATMKQSMMLFDFIVGQGRTASSFFVGLGEDKDRRGWNSAIESITTVINNHNMTDGEKYGVAVRRLNLHKEKFDSLSRYLEEKAGRHQFVPATLDINQIVANFVSFTNHARSAAAT